MLFKSIHKIITNRRVPKIHFGKSDKTLSFTLFQGTRNEWKAIFASGNMDFINQKFEQIEKPSQLAVLFNGAFYIVDIISVHLNN